MKRNPFSTIYKIKKKLKIFLIENIFLKNNLSG